MKTVEMKSVCKASVPVMAKSATEARLMVRNMKKLPYVPLEITNISVEDAPDNAPVCAEHLPIDTVAKTPVRADLESSDLEYIVEVTASCCSQLNVDAESEWDAKVAAIKAKFEYNDAKIISIKAELNWASPDTTAPESTIPKVEPGYKKETFKEPLILKLEDWTDSEWETICRLCKLPASTTERIVLRVNTMEVCALSEGSESNRTYIVSEHCANCGSEISMVWDTNTLGFRVTCPVCGKELMIFLEPEDWTCPEWKTLCKLCKLPAATTDRIILHIGTMEQSVGVQPVEPKSDRTYMVSEYCANCESEISMKWDTDTMGFRATCPVCGEELMLCDECRHCDGPRYCDWDRETGRCWRVPPTPNESEKQSVAESLCKCDCEGRSNGCHCDKDEKYPELSMYDEEDHRRDMMVEYPDVNGSVYEVVFDVEDLDVEFNRYYCYIHGVNNIWEALGVFFWNNPHITYDMIVDHMEV